MDDILNHVLQLLPAGAEIEVSHDYARLCWRIRWGDRCAVVPHVKLVADRGLADVEGLAKWIAGQLIGMEKA